MSKTKITHIITGLNMGGAETMLFKLLKYMDREKYDAEVISMMDEGVYGSKIRNLGINVHSLNMTQGKPSIKGFIKAKKYILNSDIIQTWMYHADLFGYFLYKFSKTKKLIWGIRRNNLDPSLNKKTTLSIAKFNSNLSKKVDTVVSCSIKAKKTHLKFGYHDKNMIVIPNGFELERFRRIEESKKQVSSIINKGMDIPYIIHVGRYNILKDHKNFLKALGMIKKQGIQFHAIMIGSQVNNQNAELMDLISKYDLHSQVNLLDRRDDIPVLMSGSDIFVSSSIDEGFPNVVGEAMACETPCVVTDAGDSAYIVGDTGKVVPIQNSNALANAIMELLSLTEEERNNLGTQARKRVIEKFDIKKVTNQFEQLYQV